MIIRIYCYKHKQEVPAFASVTTSSFIEINIKQCKRCEQENEELKNIISKMEQKNDFDIPVPF